MIKLIYLISIIVLIVMFMKIKKVSDKQNIIMWFIISIILFMCFNSLVIFILSIFNIKSYLLLRTLINIIFSIIFYIKFIKVKGSQKYSFNLNDLIVLIILLIITCVVGYFRFGADLHINFETIDPAVHYFRTREFYETNILYEKTGIESVYGSSVGATGMYFGYTNAGTAMQIFDIVISEIRIYKIFIIFELFAFFISASLLYFTITKNSKRNKIFACLISTMYVLGYPLNNLIFGFHYLGLGVLLINLIMLLVDIHYNDKIVYKKLNKLLIAIPVLMLFMSYYLFVPAIYAGIGFYILYLWKFKEKLTLKQSIIDIIVMLVVPFVIGMLYIFIVPAFIKSEASNVSGALATEGYIYRNLIGNFIFLIPIVIYAFIEQIKKKDINVSMFNFILISIFTVLLFLLVVLDKASTYYFYKTYYVLWLLMFLIVGKAGIEMKSSLIKIYSTFYLMIIILMASGIEQEMTTRHILLNPSPFSSLITDVYSFNLSKINPNESTISDEEVSLMNEVYKNKELLDEDGEIVVFGNEFEKLWIYSIYNITPFNNFTHLMQFYYDNITFEDLKEDESIEYFVVFNDNEWYDKYSDSLEDLEIVFSNSSGSIYKK